MISLIIDTNIVFSALIIRISIYVMRKNELKEFKGNY